MKVNKLQIGFTDEGRGLPLLFVHAFPLGRQAWPKQGEALRSPYRIIAPDLRRYGEREGAAGTVTRAEQVRSNGVRTVVAAMAPKILATDNRDASLPGEVRSLMRAKAKQAIPKGNITAAEELDSAEAKFQVGKAKLKQLRKATEGAWEELKEGVDSAWSSIFEAWQKAVDKIK